MIPKHIYQVWHDKKNLPPFYKKYNEQLKTLLPDYLYTLFDLNEINEFVNTNYIGEISECYNKLNTITSRVDFWRYLYLFKYGGIYLDIDSMILKNIDPLINNFDCVITREPNPPYTYVQWALFYSKEHPILLKTINLITSNIKYNLTNNILELTGPVVYTKSIDNYINIDRSNTNLWSDKTPDIEYSINSLRTRIYGIEYGEYALSWVPEKNQMYSKTNPHCSSESKLINNLTTTNTKGFVIFCNKSYLPIIINLINSVLEFSKYNIELFCINFHCNINNLRVKTNRISIPKENFYNITKCKIIASIQTSFDYALLLDGDMIVTKDIDNIFDDNEEKIQKVNYPLFCKHPHNPYERWKHIINRITNKTPVMKWVYSVYLFTKKHKWFFKETLDIMNKITYNNEEHLYATVPEEGIMNGLLAKYEINDDMGYCYHVNGFKDVVNYYLNGDEKGKNHIEDTYLKYNCPVKLYAFHGHDIKNIEYGKQVIQMIKLK